MKRLIIALVVGLFTTQINAQDCAKYVAPKWQIETYSMADAYNANDYEWQLVSAGLPPVTKTYYKQVIVKDGYTGIDSVKTKLTGKLCTKWFEPEYITIIDWVEVVKPATPPQFAWVKKTKLKSNSYTKLKNTKDGQIIITYCE